MSAEQPTPWIEGFELLISSLARRHVAVTTAAPGCAAYFDGCCICVSARSLSDPDERYCEVVVQALLLGIGSIRPDRLRRLIGRPVLARSYLCLEIWRGLVQLGDVLPRAFILRSEWAAIQSWPLANSAEQSMSMAQSWRAPAQVPAFFGTLNPMQTLRHALRQDGMRPATDRDVRAGLDASERADDGPEQDGQTQTSSILEKLKSPLSNGNPLGEALARLFGQRQSRNEMNAHANGVDEMPVGGLQQVFRRGVHSVQSLLSMGVPRVDHRVDGAVSARRYPEWDHRAGRYRPGWVRVEETEPWLQDEQQDAPLALPTSSPALRRGLSRLGLEFEMHRRQREGSEFDVGELIEHAIEQRCGHTARHLDIYRASRKTRRDMGVVVVIDISGSSGEQGADGEMLLRRQLAAGWQMATALDSLGDCVALYGFHSWGREAANMVRIKGPAERWSGAICERIGWVRPGGFSRLGAAIRHADHVLHHSIRLPNRLIVMISDGFAYDHDYEQEHAREDTAAALREAQESGTACVCLTVGASALAAQVDHVWGPAHRLMLDDRHQWEARIGGTCRQALASVRTGRNKKRARRPGSACG